MAGKMKRMAVKVVPVKVIPGSSYNSISGYKDGEIIIKVKAQPEKGKANRELVKYLSKLLGIAKSDIEVLSGETSRHKRLSLPDAAASELESLAREK